MKTYTSRFMYGFGDDLLAAGTGGVTGAISNIAQIPFQLWGMKQQEKQQQRMIDMQTAANMQMGNFNYQKQLDYWNATNYEAQLEHMKRAGLNPAIMYGKGGAGGSTIGPVASGVSGGSASNPMTNITTALQAQSTAADIELKKSQANLNNVEAQKTSGVDTEQVKANIESIWQGIDNARQAHTIQKLEITMKNIENFEKQASQEDRLDYIEYQTKLALKQLTLATNDAKISGATVQDRINQIKTEAVGAVLKNILTSAQTEQTRSATSLNTEQIKKIANDIMLNWDRLSNENKEIEIKKALMQWTTDPNREAINQAVGVLDGIMHNLKKGTTINNY